jgi:hypothetical protein
LYIFENFDFIQGLIIVLVNLIKNISFSSFSISVINQFKLSISYFLLIGVTSLYAAAFAIWALIVFPQKSDAQMYA